MQIYNIIVHKEGLHEQQKCAKYAHVIMKMHKLLNIFNRNLPRLLKKMFYNYISVYIARNIREYLRVFIISLITSLFVFVILTSALPSQFIDLRNINYISKKYADKYEVKLITRPIKPEINPSFVYWGNDVRLTEICTSEESDNVDLLPPIIDIYKKSDFNILSLMPFFKQDYTLHESIEFPIEGNAIGFYIITDVSIEDLNGDGIDEIIVQMLDYNCWSMGKRINLVLNQTVSGYEVVTSLPDLHFYDDSGEVVNLLDADEIEVKDTDNKYNIKKSHIYTISMDAYIAYKDLDGDGLKELILGVPEDDFDEWGNGETCHSCPHTWYIGVYKFNGKIFVVDNNWSYGNLYVTERKIGLYDAHGYPVLSSNLFNFLFLYLLDCEECDSFRNASRRKSELVKIVEEKYGNFKTKDEMDGF